MGARTETSRGTKAGNTRQIPLTPRAREVLERRAKGNSGPLFSQNKDQITRLWNTMRGALGHADDPEYVPHAMRHTFCSRLVMANVNLMVVQKLAGHLRIETTMRYVHLADNALVEAIGHLAPREDCVYERTPPATPQEPQATVAGHNLRVAASNVLPVVGKGLNNLEKTAAV